MSNVKANKELTVRTLEQIKKAPSNRLHKWLEDKNISQESYDLIRSTLLYREETAEKLQRAGVRDIAEKFVANRSDLQFEIVNRPMGVKNEGKHVAHRDEWYWPFHTGFQQPIGKYPCLSNSPKMQNADLIELGLKIAGVYGAEITTVAPMRDGASLLVGIKMPEPVKVGEDTYDQYIYILDNRTGEHGLRIGFGNICLRCTNQMRFVRKQTKLNVKHTAGMFDLLQNIVDNIDHARQEQAELFKLMEELSKVSVDKDTADEFIRTVCGYDEPQDGKKRKIAPAGQREYNALTVATDKEFEQVGMTAYGLLQGVTRMVTHDHQALYRKDISFDEAITYDKGADLIGNAIDLLRVFVSN